MNTLSTPYSKRIAQAVLLICVFCMSLASTTAFAKQSKALENSLLLFTNDPNGQAKALDWMDAHGKKDVIPTLIYATRYLSTHRKKIRSVLEKISGEKHGDDWFQWMLWLQANPDIQPFEGFAKFQSEIFSVLDPKFKLFLHDRIAHKIRLEEIVWGGVKKDGIPALTNPKLINADEATYLNDDDAVFGVEINGDVRAYPYRIMDWHEMFNDVVGGVPVSLAYCTLCGSGILFDTRVEGRKEPFVFGSSGFLYRSNKLMYDQETHSLWNQFTGKPVVGELTHSDIELKVLPIVTTTWKIWKQQHPKTKVLSISTGYVRDYGPGRAYGSYFNSSELMFPALSEDKRLSAKDQVFGLRISGSEKAWPLTTFADGKVINDRIGVVEMVLVGDATTRTVRAYRSGGRKFKKKGSDLQFIQHDGKLWKVSEDALIGPNGENLSRLPGHLAYWFAWSGYLNKAEFN